MATQLFQPKAHEAGTVAWFNACLVRAQHEVFSETTLMTPGLANSILAKNQNNRSVSDRKIEQYASDMRSGRWAFNGETIIIARDGSLNDGQHRMHAIIAANRPQKMLVVFGVDRETRITVDQGMARSAGHYLAMDGIENSKACASIASIVLSFEMSNGQRLKGDVTHAEIVERVKADPKIGEAAKFSNHVSKFAKGVITPAQTGAVYYLLSQIEKQEANDFLTKVCVGEGIKRGDAEFATRQALQGLKGDARLERVGLVFAGWNAMRSRRDRVSLVRAPKTLPALV